MGYAPVEKELFHVHTYRCGHAGTQREFEYVEAAIALGADRIVFTDHGPFPGNPFGNRMPYEELPDYVNTINSLKAKYQGQIEILCGLEVEYLPSFAQYYETLKNMKGMDLLIVGQHFYENKPGVYSIADPDKTYEFEGQCEAMAQAIETKMFDVIAHPDRSFRASSTLGDREQMSVRRMINALESCHGVLPYLEKNITSQKQKGYYKEEFWNMLPSYVKTNVGIDAHSIQQLTEGWNYRWDPEGKLFAELFTTKS